MDSITREKWLNKKRKHSNDERQL
jgi:hypothetical protein